MIVCERSLSKRIEINICSTQISKVASILVVLSMLGYAYVIPFAPSLTFGELGLGIFCLVLIFGGTLNRASVPKWLLFIGVYSLCVALLVGFILQDISSPIKRLLRDAFYWAIIILFGRYINLKIFMMYVKRFCVALSIFILAQVFVYHLTGYLIPGMLPFGMVDANATGQMIYDHILFWVQHAGYLKPNGFLSEASHSAQCLFIGTLFVFEDLFQKKHFNKGFCQIILFSLASVLTFSASAVIYVGISMVILFYILFKLHKKKIIYLSIGLFIIAFLLLIQLDIVKIVMRILSALSPKTNDGSAFVRVYKGFTFWSELPAVYKIFGIGVGNYTAINLKYSITTEMNEYMSSLSYFLVSNGIIGVLMILSSIIIGATRLNKKGRLYLFILFFMCIAASIYSTPYWMWLFIAISKNKKDVNKRRR